MGGKGRGKYVEEKRGGGGGGGGRGGGERGTPEVSQKEAERPRSKKGQRGREVRDAKRYV
jgi:hypothetical protein